MHVYLRAFMCVHMHVYLRAFMCVPIAHTYSRLICEASEAGGLSGTWSDDALELGAWEDEGMEAACRKNYAIKLARGHP